jgi:hypothetical protein
MEKNKTVRSVLFGKDHLKVTIDPNIDYGFIVALIVILDAIPSRIPIASNAISSQLTRFYRNLLCVCYVHN